MTSRRRGSAKTRLRRKPQIAAAVSIRRLSAADVQAYRRIRLRGLRECPTAFGGSHVEEARRPMTVFAHRLRDVASSWTYGAFLAGNLVGVVTLLRDVRRKECHKAIIVGMYVERRHRGLGIGRMLLREAWHAAATQPRLRRVRLDVTATNRAAHRLYLSEGFREYGREPDALCVAGRFYTLILLSREVSHRAG